MLKIRIIRKTVLIVSGCMVLCASLAFGQTLRSDEYSNLVEKPVEPVNKVQKKTPTLSSYAGDNGKDKRYNGENWNDLNRLMQAGDVYAGMMVKLALVRGMYEGALEIAPEKTESIYFITPRYRDITRLIDIVYADGKNERIPVVELLKVVGMELRGEDAATALEELRTKFLIKKKVIAAPGTRTLTAN